MANYMGKDFYKIKKGRNMNRFKHCIPCYIDMDEDERPQWIEFESTEDLLNMEVVQRYGKEKGSHFVLSKNLLMKVWDKGLQWWPVGHIEFPQRVELPQWEGPKPV